MAETVGQRLVQHRQRLRLTQEDVAERIDATRVTVSSHERNVTAPDDDFLDRYARLYGTTKGLLRYGANEQPPPGDEAGAEAQGEGADEVLRSHPAYWRGRQDELVGMMEYVGRMMREATVMHDRALATQREIIARTIPVPNGGPPPEGGPREPITERRTGESRKIRPPDQEQPGSG